MEILVWFCLLGTFYAYLGYPLLLQWLIGRRLVAHPQSSLDREERMEKPLSATIVVTVRNEAVAIRQKIENTLALESDVPLQVIVASDASDDETDIVVQEFSSQGVELVRLSERGGKETAQRAAIERARGDVLIFTDAKIRLEKDAARRFMAYFRDPEIGAVSSIDRIENSSTGGSGEGMYIRYEMWLRSLESQFQTLVGLSGSCFAVRKQVCRDIRTDIPSDFALLIEARKQGLRGVHAPDIIATYGAVASNQAEFQRKVRTVLRGITTFFASKEVLNPFRFGAFSWQIASHKLGRWLVPWFLLIALIGSLTLSFHSRFYAIVSLAMMIFYGLALCGTFLPKLQKNILFKLPLFFSVVNAAIAVAWYKFFTGERSSQWTPSAR